MSAVYGYKGNAATLMFSPEDQENGRNPACTRVHTTESQGTKVLPHADSWEMIGSMPAISGRVRVQIQLYF